MAYSIVDFQPLAKITRITGLGVVIFKGPFMVAHDDDGLIIWEQKFAMSKSGTKRAAEAIINNNYRHNCDIVRLKQGGKCAKCKRFKPLQFHHKKHRGSNGRDDRIQNLEGLCYDPCHREEHGG